MRARSLRRRNFRAANPRSSLVCAYRPRQIAQLFSSRDSPNLWRSRIFAGESFYGADSQGLGSCGQSPPVRLCKFPDVVKISIKEIADDAAGTLPNGLEMMELSTLSVRWLCVAVLAVMPLPSSAQSAAFEQILKAFGMEAPVPAEPAVHVDKALNYQLQIPPRYSKLDPVKVNEDANLALWNRSKGHWVMVTAEDAGLDMNSREVADFALAMLESSIKVRTLARADHRVNGIDGHLLKITGITGRLKVAYRIWVVSYNGFVYQVTSWKQGPASQEFVAASEQILEGFAVLDPDLHSDEFWDKLNPAKTASSTFGYQLPNGGRWLVSPSNSDLYQEADVAAVDRSGLVQLAVVPVCHEGLEPGLEALQSALVPLLTDTPIASLGAPQAVVADGVEGSAFSRTSEGFSEWVWIFSNAGCSYAILYYGPANDGNQSAEAAAMIAQWDFYQPSMSTAAVDELARNALALAELGDHYVAAESYRNALDYFSLAIANDPTSYSHVGSAASAYNRLSAYAEGLAFLRQVEGQFPRSQQLKSWLAWFSHKLGDGATALALYRTLFAEGYRSDEELDVLLDLLADNQHWEELDQALDQYLTSADTADRTLRLARVEMQRDEGARAVDRLSALDSNTLSSPQRVSLMNTYIDLEQYSLALDVSDQLLVGGYESANLYYQRGDAYFGLGQYLQARSALEMALERAPGSSSILDYLNYINNYLGEGDSTIVSRPIEPVSLPATVQPRFDNNTLTVADSLQDYNTVNLFLATGYSHHPEAALRKTEYRKFKVLNQSAVDASNTLQVTFDAGNERLYVNFLKVRGEQGELLTEADRSRFFITSADDDIQADEEKTLNIPVPQLQPGGIVELVYTVERLGSPGQFPVERHYAMSGRPTADFFLFVNDPLSRVVHRQHLLDPPTQGDGLTLWHTQWPTPYSYESQSPDLEDYAPWLQLGVPGDSWTVIGRDYLDTIAEYIDPQSVQEKTTKLVEGQTERAEKIATIVRYVQQNITYNAIEFGRRGYIPRVARETVRDRYGDCKDHAVLLHTMLASAGIKSHLALANLSEAVLPDMPSMDQFDHMVVYLPDDELFIDATDKNLDLPRHTPRDLDQNYVLVLSQDADLVQIPEVRPGESRIEIIRTIGLGNDNIARVLEKMSFDGYAAANMRGNLRDTQVRDLKGVFARWLQRRFPDAQLDDYYLDNLQQPQHQLEIELEFTVPVLRGANNELRLPFFLEDFMLVPSSTEPRQHPLENTVPFALSSSTVVTVDDGALSWNRDQSQGFVKQNELAWEIKISGHPAQVTVAFEFEESPWQADAEFYTEYQRQLKQMHQQLSQSLTWSGAD